MPLKIDLTNHKTPNNEMTYDDFFIRFEHKFLRNIYSCEKLAQSEHKCSSENYYTTYKKFVNIYIGILSIFGTNSNISDNINNDLKEFLREKFPDVDDDIDNLKSNIELIEIKSYVKCNKIAKFNLKLYALVYNSLTDFSRSKFNYGTITKNNFFGNVHKYIKVKIHLHHSHTTEKYLGTRMIFVTGRSKKAKMRSR